ncbi:MAG TPA: hypothetical protein VGL99_26920 [Chloroflexota bacterium]|jgi:CheY-like chemotaxis protein
MRYYVRVLGVTSYQEALRALGACAATDFRLREQPAEACISLSLDGATRGLSASELIELIESSRARRGAASSAWPLSDLLRSVGLVLDELEGLDLDLVMCADSLDVAFRTHDGYQHVLSYAGEELVSLRQAAQARRKGYPLRRVLVLHGPTDSATNLRELLLAEFAVQSLPTSYARAIAEAGALPDAILANTDGDTRDTLQALRVLRASPRTEHVPIIVIARNGARLDAGEAFVAGADDVLQAPYQPAQLRARLRTWLLRGGGDKRVLS